MGYNGVATDSLSHKYRKILISPKLIQMTLYFCHYLLGGRVMREFYKILEIKELWENWRGGGILFLTRGKKSERIAVYERNG